MYNVGFEVIAQLKDSSSNSEENLSISSAKSDNEIKLRNSTQENTASKDAKVDSVSKQLQDEQISFQINNLTLAQCREIPSGLQGKLKVSTEVYYSFLGGHHLFSKLCWFFVFRFCFLSQVFFQTDILILCIL